MPSSEVMGKFKHGTLRSWSGAPVDNRKQAIAIMLSEQRAEAANGGKYPERRSKKAGKKAKRRPSSMIHRAMGAE